MSQQKGARRAPVLQQWGEGVGVPWEHSQTVPLQDRDVPTAGTAWQHGPPACMVGVASSPEKGGCQYLQLQISIDLWSQQAEQI